MIKDADFKTETHRNTDVRFEEKIAPADFIKGYRRPNVAATGMDQKAHHKTRSTGASIDNMATFRSLHSRSRGPSIDITRQLTNRKMYGNSLPRATTMTWDENLEKLQNEFPVLPYYKDESKTTIAIPPSLQVKESAGCLRYQSTNVKESAWCLWYQSKDDQCPQELEKMFVQQRFYKSRRLVRICIIILGLFILFSAAIDDCELLKNILNEHTEESEEPLAEHTKESLAEQTEESLGNHTEESLGESLAESLCTNDTSRRILRRYIFCAVQPPILFTWFLATFTKFYEENLTWLPSLFVVAIGGLMLASTVIGQTPDSAVYMCYLFIVWLFIRIPFWSACLVTSFMFIIAVMLFTTLREKMANPLVEILYLTTTNICLMYAAHFWERSDRVEFLESRILNHIKGNSKNLLNQILPMAVQERIHKAFLTTKGDDVHKPIADEANDVSVLFSDIKGFTKFCSGVKAVEVVRALNTLYMTFDDSLEKLDVFKVETIGDAYFVSANCPIKAPDHARRLVILGKEMIKACAEFTPCGARSKEYKFQMRIGVHSGKVCAGIVGRKMPRYHLFGQTVTIAECMESSGVPGKVQISEDTLTYLQEWEKNSQKTLDFSFESRGERK